MKKGLIVLAVVLAGCASTEPQQQAMEEMKQPINCATAEGDLRMLESEKAHVEDQVAAGVTAIVPVGLIVGVATDTEETKYEVASGDYNKMIDQRIADIKQTCGV